VQTFTSRDGLSADSSTPILEDREGNIWVGTRDGLDQFRDTALVPVVLPTSLYRVAVAPADGGYIWFVGSWAYASKTHGDYGEVSFVPSGAFKTYRDPSAVTWFLSDSLEQWKDGGFRKVAEAPYSHGGGGSGSWQVAGDGSGTVWAFSNGHGFFSLDNNHWKPWATPPELAKQRVVNMFSDCSGRIWVSTYEGDIITMDRGTVVDYPVKPDRPLRDVKAFAERAPQQIWAGGAGGLVMIDRGHFRLMKPGAMDSLEDVTGIVDAGSNGLWLTAQSLGMNPGFALQRLFSTFPNSWPGFGLLLLRLGAGIALVYLGISLLGNARSTTQFSLGFHRGGREYLSARRLVDARSGSAHRP